MSLIIQVCFLLQITQWIIVCLRAGQRGPVQEGSGSVTVSVSLSVSGPFLSESLNGMKMKRPHFHIQCNWSHWYKSICFQRFFLREFLHCTLQVPTGINSALILYYGLLIVINVWINWRKTKILLFLKFYFIQKNEML